MSGKVASSKGEQCAATVASASPTLLSQEPNVGAARRAAQRAAERLLRLQKPEGFWVGEAEINVQTTTADLFLREFLGTRTEEVTRVTAQWIRSQQNRDGGWTTCYEGPIDASATVEAYLALRLAGDPPDAEHMLRAASIIREMGGIEESRGFPTRFWLALFGLSPWERLPAVPPELILLPSWVPLNIYDFAAWVRPTVVMLMVLTTYQPVHSLQISLSELEAPIQRKRRSAAKRIAHGIEHVMHAYHRHPVGWLRRIALAKAERWIIRRQEADGSWGGIICFAQIALSLLGYPPYHPLMRSSFEGADRRAVVEDDGRWVQGFQSPILDTALAVIALSDAGVTTSHPALIAAADWLVERQIRTPGDWRVQRPDLEPGGWSMEFTNDYFPDLDDTSYALMALRRVTHPHPDVLETVIARGLRWASGMQSRNGGWGAFDADHDRNICRRMLDSSGEVIDPPSADVTGHVVEMLAHERSLDANRIDLAVKWLLGDQYPDGSWFGRWGVNHVYGVGAVVPALVAACVPKKSVPIRRAVSWLEEHQNADGGWGEDIRSYSEADRWGRGSSTPTQTAWALLALLAANEELAPSIAIERGIAFLLGSQSEEGAWQEPWFTGAGLPPIYLIRYRLHSLLFPLMAIGRYAQMYESLSDDG